MPVTVKSLPFLWPYEPDEAGVREEHCFGGHVLASVTYSEEPFACSHKKPDKQVSASTDEYDLEGFH